jgi:hypothetical protein
VSESPRQPAGGLEIRSFRVVFELERRIHRIQHWRVPLPYGLPVRGLAYGALALLAIVLAGRLPLVGELVGALPPPVRFVLLPAALGATVARARVDGRPAHRFLAAWLRHRVGPRRLNAFRPIEPVGTVERIAEPIAFLPDSRAPRYRRGRLRGEAAVLLRYPARAVERRRGRRLELRQTEAAPLARGKEVVIGRGQELAVR